jgi:AAA+ superfamily predicted ATPase
MTTAIVSPPEAPVDGSVDRKREWFQTYEAHWYAASGTVFNVWGNVFDYEQQGYPVSDWLAGVLPTGLKDPRLVIRFRRDEGITFPIPTMAGIIDSAEARSEFMKLAGMAEQQDAATQQATDLASIMAGKVPTKGPKLPKEPFDAISLIVRVLKAAPEMSSVAIIERADLLVEQRGQMTPPEKDLLSLVHSAGTDADLNAAGNTLILLSPALETLPADWRRVDSGIRAIHIPLPDFDERLAYIHQRLAAPSMRGVTLEMEPEALAGFTASLPLRAIEDMFLVARTHTSKRLSSAMAREMKKELMATEYADVLEPLETNVTLDMFGGNEPVKGFILKRLVKAFQRGLRKVIPLNLLFMGSPGTGKTLLARALAAALGITILLLKPERIRGRYVGESEAKWAKAVEGILASRPCGVLVDEAEQKFRRVTGGGSGGDSVEANLFSGMLEFFGDDAHRGDILGLFLTNRPDLMDPAWLSRMEVRIPILPAATAETRGDILGRILRRMGEDVPLDAPWLTDLGGLVDGFSGRDLEGTVVKALALKALDDLTIDAALRQAVETRRPEKSDDVDLMTQLALDKCSDLDLLPPERRVAVTSPSETKKRQERISVLQDRERAPRERRT